MLVVLAETDCRAYLNARNIYPNELFNDLDELQKMLIFYDDVDLIVMIMGMIQFHRRKISEFVNKIKRDQEEGTSNVNNLCVVSDVTLPKVDVYYKYTTQPTRAKLHNGWDKVKGKDFEDPLKPFQGIAVKCKTHFKFPHRTLVETDVVKKERELIDMIQKPDIKQITQSIREMDAKKAEKDKVS